MSYIMSFFSFIQAVVFLWRQISQLLREVDAKKAQDRRDALNAALDKLQTATTPEEQQNAIRDITKNSF